MMTSKHRLTCIAISAAVALKLFAGTADAGVSNGETDARKGRVLLTVLHDASGRLDGAEFYAGRFIFNQAGGHPIFVTDMRNPVAPMQLGRGIDIARVDGEIVTPGTPG
jgi:hypothetical protein